MPQNLVVIDTFYPEFLQQWYAAHPGLADHSFDEQMESLFSSFFGVSNAYSHGLRMLGFAANDVVCNADDAQVQWAREHGVTLGGNIHERRRQIIAAQVAHEKPDAVLVFEWCPLGDAFLAELRRNVPLLIGQIASPLPADRTFGAYDLILSSLQPIIDYFRRMGKTAEPFRLAFDPRVLQQLETGPPESEVTFVGGFGPTHRDRIEWLERLMRDVPLRVYGYGLEQVAPRTPLLDVYHGPVWGLDMYRVLHRSRVTLNRHARIDVRGTVCLRYANNMRLYEAAGVGTCLVTDAKENLREILEPGSEVATYRGNDECAETVIKLLGDEPLRSSIALRGRSRVIRDHVYPVRMKELLHLISSREFVQ